MISDKQGQKDTILLRARWKHTYTYTHTRTYIHTYTYYHKQTHTHTQTHTFTYYVLLSLITHTNIYTQSLSLSLSLSLSYTQEHPNFARLLALHHFGDANKSRPPRSAPPRPAPPRLASPPSPQPSPKTHEISLPPTPISPFRERLGQISRDERRGAREGEDPDDLTHRRTLRGDHYLQRARDSGPYLRPRPRLRGNDGRRAREGEARRERERARPGTGRTRVKGPRSEFI